VRAEAAASPDQTRAFDLARADKWEEQARTKQLPSTRTEIGAGGELIDVENRWDGLGVVDTVADPDYVTASASRERLELANEAGSLDLALDVADSIQQFGENVGARNGGATSRHDEGRNPHE
jgi:hypothetical protein